MTLTGIDASRHQGVINWPQVVGAGHSFAFLKATDGVRYQYVNWFLQNAPQVQAAGLVLGAYHFLVDHHPGDAQARYFVETVGRLYPGFAGVVPIVDIEREADGTTPGPGVLREFVLEFHRLVPGRPILIYTGRWYWVGVLKDPYGADLGPLWHSEYDGLTPIDEDVANGPEGDNYGGWAHCTVWQHTSNGACPGIPGRCDLNLFHGELGELVALAGGTPVPVPEEDDMPAVSLARDPRDGKVYQVVDFTDARHLTNDDRVWIAAAYWSAKGVPDAELAVTDWDPADLDPIIAHSSNVSAPPPGPVDPPAVPWPVVSGEFTGTVTLSSAAG